ncbi:TetR/AcrR family transcriptional regulator [Mycobacterium shimoidei]|uniref:TetR/AcrR family transcriptional regulator n=1 Tax=Mycobacterium shimoidei TaxID=29313 RepID=UPI0008492322|nr:helix-turn-helix domain-containing protein [Mycobacterium shimoidei]MCV7257225.1 TetR/AcrR family transcriptional regulator [Mycobacterium shimoidei]ODR14432.1 transcriptional regulator [Mycobacterium shimoidei]ORW80508.1 transcriptional regulator [Mycobacterium shimoidei]
MAGTDWLVGQDRGSESTKRIHAAAADLIARRGWEAFTIDALAAEVHCSPATIYRHAGGKTTIRDAVVGIHAARTVETVREAISGLTGAERVVEAMALALERARSDPLTKALRSAHPPVESDWLTTSEVIAEFAAEMLGQKEPDPLAQQWLIRVFLALWTWPMRDPDAEYQMLQRFLGPPYGDEA